MSADPHVAYVRRYFRAWLPVYDLFGAAIVPVYRAAAAAVEPRPGLSVLDACTGTGEMAIRLARRGAAVTGVDVSLEMLAKARRKARGLGISFLAADARALPFADRSFDVAVLALALHDMPRRMRVEALREARRVARDRVVVLDYRFPARQPLRRAAIRAIQSFETAYLTRYADEEVAPLLAEAGLRPESVRDLRPFPFAVHVARP